MFIRSSVVRELGTASPENWSGIEMTVRAGLTCETSTTEAVDESPRKEVIQPQVPLRLPCYDLVPVTDLTVGRRLLAVDIPTSGTTGFHHLTGGVYKAQEHIHRVVADTRLLAIPTSCRRVAACNPNWGGFLAICSTLRFCVVLYPPL